MKNQRRNFSLYRTMFRSQYRSMSSACTAAAFVGVWVAMLGSPLLPSAAAQTSAKKPVAMVGEEPVYATEFLPQIEGKVYKIRLQAYELQRMALEDVINQRLLQAEAEMWNITAEDLLRQEVDSLVPEPTDEEVEQRFVMQMFRGGGQISESQDDIRKQIRQSRVQAARGQYFQMLREKANVKIYLLPPAMDVGYDRARVRGNPDAGITMVEFSDFQCPYCEQAYLIVKELLKKYDGKVKLAYRDLPLQEVQSDIHGAGEASRCAGEQGKFWEYHDLLFENQDEYGENAFNSFAEHLGLDTARFSACLESGKFKPLVQADFDEGIRLGATGTPAFFINGIFVNGARPQNEFEEIIDGLLVAME